MVTRWARAAAAVVAAAALVLPAAGPASAAGPGTGGMHLAATVTLPGKPLRCVDLSYITPDHQWYLLADASNRRIDRIRVRDLTAGPPIRPPASHRFTGCGQARKDIFDFEGPQGLFVQGGLLYAGNGDSSVLVFTWPGGRFIRAIGTGGTKRADELAGNGQAVLVTNPDESSPFLSLIGQSSLRIIRRITIPGATALEQPAWNPVLHRWMVAVFSVAGQQDGEVAVLTPGGHLARVIPTPGCNPSGLALNLRGGTMALGCDFGQPSLIVAWQGIPVNTLAPASGVDEVAPGNGVFYFGSFESGACVLVSWGGLPFASLPAAAKGVGFHACNGVGHVHGTVFVPGLPGVAIWKG